MSESLTSFQGLWRQVPHTLRVPPDVDLQPHDTTVFVLVRKQWAETILVACERDLIIGVQSVIDPRAVLDLYR